MTEGALNLRKGPNSTALAVVILIHGAALTALALSKIDVIRNPKGPTEVTLIPNDPPPPPPIDPPKAKVQPKVPDESVTVTPTIVPTIETPIYIDALPLPPNPLPLALNDGPSIPEPQQLPQTPPAPKKVQPARAKANLASYVSNDDYPASAQRDGQQGTTRFKLVVDANGRVSSCAVTQSSGSAALDAATCKLMRQRARFNPAHDDLGRATPDQVASAIRWVLPEA
jgi:protein TonB